ncbi:alpha/beta fold hydrolase [Sphingopyxis sp.]|uniref:alpha/beta hydrolase family protein n=1 Tax=Sphingopyxis sp. TaxID=1908224 RepID=UPI00262AC6DA|nr:alpha/beta fold hydrolase [Sphingopyxis sp.]MCW0199257.1 lysophospholipase [Sphingopyxis sp.]
MMRQAAGAFALAASLGASLAPALAAPEPPGLPWSAPATTRVVTEDRRFVSGDAELAGTLYLPVSGKPVAAIVVTHSASSPLRSASLYDHLKTILPALGIAVFTYDRRGSGQSGKQDAGGDFTILADDTVAAVRHLKTDPRIDPRRIGTWGLSQGGWISPLAASRSPDIAFVVAVSAPVVTADVQMIFSSTNHLKANGYSQADIDQMVAARKAVDDYMRGTVSRTEAQTKLDGIKTKPWFKYLYMGETFRDRDVSGWRKEIENDPLVNLKAVTVPTLILYGADDAVVPVADSMKRLKAIAPQMPRMEVHVIAGADHAMQMSEDLKTSLDPKYDGTERPDSPEYFALLSSWLAARGFIGN